MTQATDQTGQQQGLAGQASAKAQEAASAAQDKASELREQGSARLQDQFDRRSNQAGTQVRSLAEALRRSGTELGSEGSTNAAQLTGQAADRIERLGRYLEQKRGEELMHDIEGFARRRPWMLAGIGMLAGVAAARFMKASSEQRYDNYRQTRRQEPSRPNVDRQPQLPSGSRGPTSESGVAGSATTRAVSDEPLERDPYAGSR